MTGRETLTMFARLRGVQKDQIEVVVQNLMDRLTLTPHADKVSEAYSGGNKRKLSLGIAALVGHGGALLVDESSSGMDPAARRKMWSLMQELAKHRSVVLTTHSMEEAEALCSRIAIMDRGRFVAMGTVQQLKTKYLDGYTIDMNFTTGTPDGVVDAAVADLIESILPGSRIAERYGRFLRFNVDGVSKVGLGTTFRLLQEFKASKGCVESYSVSQW
jgi:ABC-type multidrug transport system ATPase subunit